MVLVLVLVLDHCWCWAQGDPGQACVDRLAPVLVEGLLSVVPDTVACGKRDPPPSIRFSPPPRTPCCQ